MRAPTVRRNVPVCDPTSSMKEKLTPAKRSQSLVELLRRSDIFRDYSRAFRETTGLPLGLRALDSLHLAMGDSKDQNPFCVLLGQTNQSCAACLSMRKKVEEQAGLKTKTLKCFAGLCETVVPVRVGENTIAYLQTGQVLLQQPQNGDFSRMAAAVLKWGSEIDVKRLEEAYFQTRVLSRKQYESIVRLLEIFAQHLATLSNQLIVKDQLGESPMIQRAKSFIDEHQAEDLRLNEVAKAVNTSAYYFCKMFKQATGLTFTNYLARVRVEKVKNLLLNPHVRVSEAAFQVGFQSLSQFNRVFRSITGESPSSYRERVLADSVAGLSSR
ncbi:MAG TPA: helix-turn-helix domain-containing protein [Opitutaceae bacterium]|nr:helix-turn-helix domain-containing protein [Opitutaceae bacterium]